MAIVESSSVWVVIKKSNRRAEATLKVLWGRADVNDIVKAKIKGTRKRKVRTSRKPVQPREGSHNA